MTCKCGKQLKEKQKRCAECNREYLKEYMRKKRGVNKSGVNKPVLTTSATSSVNKSGEQPHGPDIKSLPKKMQEEIKRGWMSLNKDDKNHPLVPDPTNPKYFRDGELTLEGARLYGPITLAGMDFGDYRITPPRQKVPA